MKFGNLEFKPILENKNLVSKNILEFIDNNFENKNEIFVVKIDHKYAGGEEFCEHYNIDKMDGFNCLIVSCKRKDVVKYCALLVPVGYRYDMSGVVKKYTDSRKVAVAPLDYVLEKTNMEYGSITPIGLPSEWKILIDSKINDVKYVVLGSGLKHSKLLINTKLLLSMNNVEVIDKIAKEYNK